MTARQDSLSYSKSDTTKGLTADSKTLLDKFYCPLEPVMLALSSKDKSKVLASDAPFTKQFTSLPLLPGLLNSLQEMIGRDARPTPIQSLSLKWLLEPPHSTVTQSSNINSTPGHWQQFLLASETGSGKSIAYLVPFYITSRKQSGLLRICLYHSHTQRVS